MKSFPNNFSTRIKMEEDESKSIFALLTSAKRASETCERLSKR